jgi:SAM-dependent methyltransferase
MAKDKDQQLRQKVCEAYSAAAESPGDKHPFPIGREFAASLGYRSEWLDELPADASGAFAGVSNLAVFAELPEGATVLDLGCGAGLDSLIAGRRVGERGRVLGIDFGESMLERARSALRVSGQANVHLMRADAENLPLGPSTMERALVNGIFNLNPTRGSIFLELARVLRPGGIAYAAEIILKDHLPPDQQSSEDNWFA